MKTKKDIHTTVSRVEDESEFRLLKDRWNGLLSESPANNFFLRWEWLWCWWKAYRSENYELSILLVRSGEELFGIAPFYKVKSTWKGIYNKRSLYWLGTKQNSVISEYMDFICKNGFEDVVVGSVLEYIEKMDLADELILQQMESSSKTVEALKELSFKTNLLCSETEKKECPYITLPKKYDDFLRTLSISMRQKIRRNQTRINRDGYAVIRKTNSLAELDHDLNELIRLHQYRWESRDQPGSFSKKKFTDFLKMVSPEALENGHLELSFLSVAGSNIAALYNINYNNKIYFFQSGLDHTFDSRLSAGTLLHINSIQSAIQNGLTEYDFLMMGNFDDYKRKFTAEYRHLSSIHLVRPAGLKLLTLLKGKTSALVGNISGARHRTRNYVGN